MARARERALGEAMQHALEQAVLVAAPEARGRLYLVSARARDYVPTYRVLAEGQASDQFQVRIAAEVDVPRLLRDLQATPRAPAQGTAPAGKARILLCAAPAAAPLLPAVREALAGRGEVLRECPEGGDDVGQAAARLGVPALYLQMSWEPAQGGEPVRGTQPVLYGATARARLSLWPAGGARTEAQAEESGFAERGEAAAQAAGQAAAQAAALRILPRLSPAPVAASEGVIVSVEGLNDYAQLRQVRKALAAMPGVAAETPRRFAPGGPGEGMSAEIALSTASPAAAVGAALGRTPLAGLRLQVMPQDPHHLRVLVAAESAVPGSEIEAAPDEGKTP